LTKIGDGTEDTRRRVPRADLLRGLDPGTVVPVVDAFTQGRLLTQEQDTVEITHEALLRAWLRLRQWIDTDRAGNLIRQELDDATAAWDRNRRGTATPGGVTDTAKARSTRRDRETLSQAVYLTVLEPYWRSSSSNVLIPLRAPGRLWRPLFSHRSASWRHNRPRTAIPTRDRLSMAHLVSGIECSSPSSHSRGMGIYSGICGQR